jgi:hypothetical protein
MPLLRSMASALLRAAERRCLPETREWAEAMLRELDSVESDLAALLWALGGAAAIFRHSGRCAWKRLTRRPQNAMGSQNREGQMNQTGKNALGLFAGIGIGLAISAAVIGLWMVYFQYLPGMDGSRITWKIALLALVLPETIFLTSTAILWRKRRPMALGVLLIAIVAGLHFASHLAHYHHHLHG